MPLFTPFQLGPHSLSSRIVMSPMTRSRAPGNLPNPLMAEYYGQRAAAGLIVTEGTSPSPNGLGYPRIPGLFTAEQASGWQGVTSAVHARGGHIFVQLMHTGRVGSRYNLPDGAALVAPSAVTLPGTMWTDSHGEQPHDPPRALSLAEIDRTLEEYVQAARLALTAGFDGVELHGANGYLITQFLDPGSNRRDDAFGGDATRRNRFALEVAERVAAAIGRERTGIRLSPYGVFNEMSGAYPGIAGQYAELAVGLGRLGLAYVHLVDHSAMGAPQPDPATVAAIGREFRAHGGQALILSGGYDAARATADLQSGAADLIAFGRPFIANPDLVHRLRHALPLATADPKTFYTPGPVGYTDYPPAS